MIEITNTTTKHIDTKLIEEIVSSITDRDIDILICDNLEIQRLNREYRGIDKPTDVLSFPLEFSSSNMPIGSLAISIDKVYEKADELGHTPEEELALLTIHGTLHLLGMDHEIDNGEMRAEEERLIREFNLPDSLIVRTQKEE